MNAVGHPALVIEECIVATTARIRLGTVRLPSRVSSFVTFHDIPPFPEHSFIDELMHLVFDRFSPSSESDSLSEILSPIRPWTVLAKFRTKSAVMIFPNAFCHRLTASCIDCLAAAILAACLAFSWAAIAFFAIRSMSFLRSVSSRTDSSSFWESVVFTRNSSISLLNAWVASSIDISSGKVIIFCSLVFVGSVFHFFVRCKVRKPRVKIPTSPEERMTLVTTVLEASEQLAAITVVGGAGEAAWNRLNNDAGTLTTKWSAYQSSIAAAKVARSEFDTVMANAVRDLRLIRDAAFAFHFDNPVEVANYGFEIATSTATNGDSPEPIDSGSDTADDGSASDDPIPPSS